ncbi:hypothetical protein MZD81_24625, partial [Escherichia coli]|nr:hypothetical protein [Escherichia coli]
MSARELSHKALVYEGGEILSVSPFFAQLLQHQINQELYYLAYSFFYFPYRFGTLVGLNSDGSMQLSSIMTVMSFPVTYPFLPACSAT